MIGILLRFKTAVALVLLGLLTLLAGIGQKTIWAPAETVTATAPAGGTAAPLTVFDEKLRTLHGGTVKIHVKGEGNFMLAAGRPDDVDAWVGKTAHNTVTGVSEDGKSLQLEHTDGEATAPSPGRVRPVGHHGERQRRASTTPGPRRPTATGRCCWPPTATKAAPSSISMTFPNDTSTPWAIPLMVLGGTADPGGSGTAAAQAARGTSDGTARRFRRAAAARRQPCPVPGKAAATATRPPGPRMRRHALAAERAGRPFAVRRRAGAASRC